MKAKLTRIFFLAQTLILMAAVLGPVGPLGKTPALAQPAMAGESPPPTGSGASPTPTGSGANPNAPSVAISPTLSYQGKLVESGVPVTGNRSMIFCLYNENTGGTLLWSEGPKTVAVSNGLFTVTLGDTTSFDVNIFAQQLYLEINVAGTVLPRQILQGAPYALSLAPGADVVGSSGESMLYAGNSGWGEGVKGESYSGNGIAGNSYTSHGVYAESNGSGIGGSALYAKSTGASGIALTAHNASPSNSETAMVLENDGTGALLKGFGGDSGNDEFNFKNDGTFQDKAPSYIFVPGAGAYLNPGSSGVTFEPLHGAVYIHSSTTGLKDVCLSATLPSVLYGQPVQIEQVSIYYRTVTWLSNYIYDTYLFILNQAGDIDTVGQDNTTHNSNTYSSYDVYSNANLSADYGIFSICLTMIFQEVSTPIFLGGARIRLRHHPLY